MKTNICSCCKNTDETIHVEVTCFLDDPISKTKTYLCRKCTCLYVTQITPIFKLNEKGNKIKGNINHYNVKYLKDENHISDITKMVEEVSDDDLCEKCSNEMIACVCMEQDDKDEG